MRPLADRIEAWQRPADFDQIASVISLGQVVVTATRLLQGDIRGRGIVKI